MSRSRIPTKPSKRAIANNIQGLSALALGTTPVFIETKPRAKQKAPERDVMDAVREWARMRGIVLFRNNTGQYEAAPGRWVRFGLTTGSSDFIGWRTVGGLAQFVAIECKAPGKKATPEQQQFIDRVNASGGLAGCVTSISDCESLLGEWVARNTRDQR